jgi:hypothetical protein
MAPLKKIGIAIFIFFRLPWCGAEEINDQSILQNFELVSEPPCERAKLKEPPLPTNFFWYERNYVSVDDSRRCQIHQFAIYWMSESTSSNARYTESILYRFENGKWIEEYGLLYIPKFRIRNKANNRVYLVVDKSFEDMRVDQIAYYSGSWKRVWSYPGKNGIHTLWEGCSPSEDCWKEWQAVKRAIELIAPRN